MFISTFDIFGIIHWRVFWRFSDANGSLLVRFPSFGTFYLIIHFLIFHIQKFSEQSSSTSSLPMYIFLYGHFTGRSRKACKLLVIHFETEISWYSTKESKFPIIFGNFLVPKASQDLGTIDHKAGGCVLWNTLICVWYFVCRVFSVFLPFPIAVTCFFLKLKF